MNSEQLLDLIRQGEGPTVEFKTSLFELNKDVFDTICSFLNRKGGHLILGIKDNGSIEGVLSDSIQDICKAITSQANNLNKLDPRCHLIPEIVELEGKPVIYLQVPESPHVHNTNGKYFDRGQDGDFNITHQPERIKELYLRKQNNYSENGILPFLQLSDLRSDLLLRVRVLAKNQRPNHPWAELDDMGLLRAAKLYQHDYSSGQEGFTLAAVLLLAKDEVIHSVLPHYRTDAILRVQNIDRYDDRDIVETNLIESYDRLMGFVRKHLPDTFYQEGDQRISLRDRVFREIVANLLVHREFRSGYPAKLVIEKEQVITENWNKPYQYGAFSPNNFTPFAKNPTIASFFREIGWVDELGSGVRNVFKYTRHYSKGKDPVFLEEDVFKTIIPTPSLQLKSLSNQGNQEGNQVGKGDALSERAKQLLKDLGNQEGNQVDGGNAFYQRAKQLLEGTLEAELNINPSDQKLEQYKPLLKDFQEDHFRVLNAALQPLPKRILLEGVLKLSNQTKNFKTYIEPLLEKGLLQRTVPDRPNSKFQAYFTTERGKILLYLYRKEQQ